MDIPSRFLINMFLCFSFSLCLQVLVSGALEWFYAARGESERCILLWCLAAQIVAARHLPSCWQLYFPVHHTCTRGLSCCDTKLWSSHVPPNWPDLSCVDYRIWTVVHECAYQKWSLSCVLWVFRQVQASEMARDVKHHRRAAVINKMIYFTW